MGTTRPGYRTDVRQHVEGTVPHGHPGEAGSAGRHGEKPLRPPPRLALIVPCYNEESLIRSTCATLLSQLDELVGQDACRHDSFIVFIDDGSADSTWTLIEEMAAAHPLRVRGIGLATNSGHQFALVAGIDYAIGRADASVSMDADLQDDPAVISQMMAAYREGAELVLGVRRSRAADTYFKKLSASAYYRLLHILGVQAVEQHADFRLMSKAAMANLQKFPEYHLFLRAFPKLLHNRIVLVTYDRAPRLAGESKYPLLRMLSLAWTGVTAFSVMPLRIISIIGGLVFVSSACLALYAILTWIGGGAVPGWASITVPLYVLGGLVMLSIGIVGEYVGKIYSEVKRRPRYLVDRVAGDGGADADEG